MRLLAVLLLAPTLWTTAIAPQVATARPAQGERQMTPLVTGWRFKFGPEESAVIQPKFDDSHWQPVSLPHTWNRLGEYGPVRSEATDARQGVGWYRLGFKAPSG